MVRTPTRRNGRRLAVSEAKSTLPAVSPPTWAVRPVWCSTAGRVSCRSRSMSAAVCRSAGPHAGVTCDNGGRAGRAEAGGGHRSDAGRALEGGDQGLHGRAGGSARPDGCRRTAFARRR